MTDDSMICLKTVILGEPGVGKTCLANRLVHNTFKECDPTTGASYSKKVITFPKYNRNIKFDIWDTAGQEKYRSMNKIFYKDAKIAILVYDITRKSSFEEIKNYWLEQIKSFGEKEIIIAVAANKSDLYDHEEVDEGIGRGFAQSNNLIFRYTSAKNASGIDELFESIGEKLLDPEQNGKTPEKKENVRNTIILNKQNKKDEDKGGCCK